VPIVRRNRCAGRQLRALLIRVRVNKPNNITYVRNKNSLLFKGTSLPIYIGNYFSIIEVVYLVLISRSPGTPGLCRYPDVPALRDYRTSLIGCIWPFGSVLNDWFAVDAPGIHGLMSRPGL